MTDDAAMPPPAPANEAIPIIIPQVIEVATPVADDQAPEQPQGEEQAEHPATSAQEHDAEGNAYDNAAEMEAEDADGSADEVSEANAEDTAEGDGLDATEQQDENGAAATPSKKKRLCRTPGCNRVIKSQGHCQRHGAKAKRCKVVGCDKQAQGTHDGMCKRHWKAVNFPDAVAAPAPKEEAVPPPPEGASVYEGILPQSISYRPTMLQKQQLEESNKVNRTDIPPPPHGEVNIMPLVTFLRQGAGKEPGWHRNAERRARGMFACTSLSSQLEPWERQLCLVEILLLSGGTPYANFKELAHAWGRERGFHNILTSSVCERRGEVDRKRRSDVGKRLTPDQREAFRQKLQRTRSIESVESMTGGLVANNQSLPIQAPAAQAHQAPPQQQQRLHPPSIPMEEDVKVDTVVGL